jgi:hypothetical protein
MTEWIQKSRQIIFDGFVEVCKNGTSKECREYVDKAKRNGISYEELCEYKRQKERK